MSFRDEYRHDLASGFREARREEGVVTEADIAHLPSAVQRYLRFTGAVGKPRVWNYRFRFNGTFRPGNGPRTIRIGGEQQSLVRPAARLFLMGGSMFGLPVLAYHRYVGPTATFRVRVASIATVVDAKGPEMDQGETVTLLNDVCLLAPAALIGPDFEWEDLGAESARVTMTNAGHAVSAVLTFDDTGAMTDFVSEDRYSTVDGKVYERIPWSTPVDGWRSVDGRKVPTRAEARWLRPEGELVYARFDPGDVEYNVEGPTCPSRS